MKDKSKLAFPQTSPYVSSNPGMTLREWYAGLAMQGILAREGWTIADATLLAVDAADKLLTELSKEK